MRAKSHRTRGRVPIRVISRPSFGTWKKFQVGFDLHGDMQDDAAVSAFFKFQEMWKPNIRIFGGDLWDFRPLRSGATEDERRESMTADCDAGMEWLARYRPHHFLKGNHCQRAWEIAEAGRGPISDYAGGIIRDFEKLASRIGCQVLPYHKRDGVLRVGHLKVTHGFGANSLSAARTHANWYGSVLLGHFHRVDEQSVPGLEQRVGRICGCLCKLDMDYNLRMPNTLAQSHGFAYGVVNDRTGNYFAWTARPVDGTWMFPSDIVQVTG